MIKHVKLGEICKILNGFAFKSEKYMASGIRVVRITNVQKGYIEDADPQFYPLEEQKNIEKYMLYEGDLLISLTGNVGRVAVLQKELLPAALNQRVACIRISDVGRVYKQYLFHYLNSDYFEQQCIISAKGVAQKNMSTEWLKEYEIPLPTIEKQREIAEIFSRIDELISERNQQTTSLEQIVKSRFIEMFGDPVKNDMDWKTTLLKNATSKIGSGATPKGGKESYQEEGITLIRSMNVHDGRFEYKDLAHITDEQAERLDNVTVKENDVFINITGASVARSCIVPNHILPARVNQHVAIIRCITSMLNPVFANNMFLNTSFKGQLLNIGESGGATRQAITKQQLETLEVILPPIESQEQFATFVEQIDKSKFEIQQSLEKLEILKKSLMQQYFG